MQHQFWMPSLPTVQPPCQQFSHVGVLYYSVKYSLELIDWSEDKEWTTEVCCLQPQLTLTQVTSPEALYQIDLSVEPSKGIYNIFHLYTVASPQSHATL